MSSTPSNEAGLTAALTPATPSPSFKVHDFDFKGTNYEMDSSISEEERRFYLKMYPAVDVVNQRKVHCTVCRTHIGTAPSTESNIKMHPILRVTHCIKCHDFYNSGEFSKGEDGSELYCRWCGQGGEVYCCSTCPFVFCKSCIIKNLSRGVIVDIEQNENWNCFKCTSKILWPLRAQHWALINYIETQKSGLQAMQLPETELRRLMQKDNSTCCRLAKAKANSLSDSMESLESNVSKRSHASSANSVKKSSKPQGPPAKRPKSSNDEVVCTPDLLSMLEPDCQISVPQKPASRVPTIAANITTTPRIVTVQQNYSGPSPISSSTSTNGNSSALPRSSVPPPLVLSSSGMRYRQSTPSPASVVRRTFVPNTIRNVGPVFHTINGFRVDLNTAAQQDSYRLPNGRLIQVKRQAPPAGSPAPALPSPAPLAINPHVIIRQQPAPPPPRTAQNPPGYGSNIGIYNPQTNQQLRAPPVVRVNNGSQVPTVNAPTPSTPTNSNGGTTITMTPSAAAKGPTLVRHLFPNSAFGTAQTQLQVQIFNAMDICTHLTGKIQTLTHSNAYTQARSYLHLKELYIHLSYLMTYAIGRFKQLQDKCIVDMRDMGFKNDANSLENGQLAAEKQASDDEDNEIEIVEPKTDTITIDSDNEEDSSPSIKTYNVPKGLKITSVTSAANVAELAKVDPVIAAMNQNQDIDVAAFSSSILASLLEVDITEFNAEAKQSQPVSPGGTVQKKQPRKKTTNKPNPALLQLERQRMEEMKRNDAKLKMKVVIKLRRAEHDFEVARNWAKQINKSASEKSDAAQDIVVKESVEQQKAKKSQAENNAKTEDLTIIKTHSKTPHAMEEKEEESADCQKPGEKPMNLSEMLEASLNEIDADFIEKIQELVNKEDCVDETEPDKDEITASTKTDSIAPAANATTTTEAADMIPVASDNDAAQAKFKGATSPKSTGPESVDEAAKDGNAIVLDTKTKSPAAAEAEELNEHVSKSSPNKSPTFSFTREESEFTSIQSIDPQSDTIGEAVGFFG